LISQAFCDILHYCLEIGNSMAQEHIPRMKPPVEAGEPLRQRQDGLALRAGGVASRVEIDIDEVLHNEEQERFMADKIRVTKLVGGLNFGTGTISTEDRLKSADDDLGKETIFLVEHGIHSERILTPVEADDDGCGDGRGVGKIRRGAEVLKRSLNRAKVFGGGLTMTVAARIGLGENAGKDLETTFSDSMSLLVDYGIEFGAHTDDHAHGDNCGCGAIDKAPMITQNAITFKAQIANAINLLTKGEAELALNDVFENFEAYGLQIKDQPYKGSAVAEKIADGGKVVKELVGPHLETHIVINAVKGMTVNQQYIRELTEGKAQVFGVDAWRMEEIAGLLYPDNIQRRHKAYLSMLVYTLATAGTLTKGDLPVYVIS
jgi:hypothetical protein